MSLDESLARRPQSLYDLIKQEWVSESRIFLIPDNNVNNIDQQSDSPAMLKYFNEHSAISI